MKYTEKLARTIEYQTNHNDDPSYEIDPITALIIANIIILLIEMLYECQKDDEDGLLMINNISGKHERILRRTLRRKLGWWAYFKRGDKYVNTFHNTGQRMTLEDLRELYKENINDVYYERRFGEVERPSTEC